MYDPVPQLHISTSVYEWLSHHIQDTRVKREKTKHYNGHKIPFGNGHAVSIALVMMTVRMFERSLIMG